jgi:hypothetical protein
MTPLTLALLCVCGRPARKSGWCAGCEPLYGPEAWGKVGSGKRRRPAAAPEYAPVPDFAELESDFAPLEIEAPPADHEITRPRASEASAPAAPAPMEEEGAMPLPGVTMLPDETRARIRELVERELKANPQQHREELRARVNAELKLDLQGENFRATYYAPTLKRLGIKPPPPLRARPAAAGAADDAAADAASPPSSNGASEAKGQLPDPTEAASEASDDAPTCGDDVVLVSAERLAAPAHANGNGKGAPALPERQEIPATAIDPELIGDDAPPQQLATAPAAEEEPDAWFTFAATDKGAHVQLNVQLPLKVGGLLVMEVTRVLEGQGITLARKEVARG